MHQILVRNVKPATYRRLKKKAAASGRSLQSEVNTLLDQAAKPEPRKVSRKKLIAMLDDFRRRFKGRKFSDSTEIIRQHRYGGEG